MQNIAGINGQQCFGRAKECGEKVKREDSQYHRVSAQELHTIYKRAYPCLRALFGRDARNVHQQQRADDDEIGDDIEPVGISNTYPGDGETTRGRADDQSQLLYLTNFTPCSIPPLSFMFLSIYSTERKDRAMKQFQPIENVDRNITVSQFWQAIREL